MLDTSLSTGYTEKNHVSCPDKPQSCHVRMTGVATVQMGQPPSGVSRVLLLPGGVKKVWEPQRGSFELGFEE